MVRVYGMSDDLVEIEGAEYPYDEVGCFDSDVRIWFDDGTIIRVGYGKKDLAIWNIKIEEIGPAAWKLAVCTDEDADIYSDTFEIDAKFVKCEVANKCCSK